MRSIVGAAAGLAASVGAALWVPVQSGAPWEPFLLAICLGMGIGVYLAALVWGLADRRARRRAAGRNAHARPAADQTAPARVPLLPDMRPEPDVWEF